MPNAKDFDCFSFFCPKMGKIQIVIDIARKIRYSLLDNAELAEIWPVQKNKAETFAISVGGKDEII